MSDAFRIASGAAGIVSLGLTIAQGLFQIAEGIGSAGVEVRGYAEEINTFAKLLNHVRNELESSNDVSADIQSLVNDVVDICGRVLQPLDGLQKTLKPLLDHFGSSPSKIRQLGLRLQWVFSKKDKVLFYRAALKEQHRILDTILEVIILQRTRDRSPQNIYTLRLCLENSMAAVSLSHRATQQLGFKICFEEPCSDTLVTTRELQADEDEPMAALLGGLDVGDVSEEGSEDNVVLVAFPATLDDSGDELSERAAHIVNGWIESHLDSESQESAQEIWYDVCALQRKVLRIASRAPTFEMAVPKPHRKDYTVGWICTGKMEFVAARAFLDETHEALEDLPPEDANTYTLGVMGKHNVVIAFVADQDLATAAAVATDLKHSFPNVKIGLLVGIGGGAPSRTHDIRLGDIVVSAPRDGMGGVIQYDLGRTIQDQPFQLTGYLNQPPFFLRAAAISLQAKHEGYGSSIKAAMAAVLDANPRLRMKFSRPDPSSDRLYQTEIVHPLGQESCQQVCDLSFLVPRHERTYNGEPAIHYGLIASANQLMRDAMIRDQLAAEKGVLCFDKVAAGVMNHFPCLVINGICSYSDSHGTGEWVGYAAMAAAAYAKELLQQIPPKSEY